MGDHKLPLTDTDKTCGNEIDREV